MNLSNKYHQHCQILWMSYKWFFSWFNMFSSLLLAFTSLSIIIYFLFTSFFCIRNLFYYYIFFFVLFLILMMFLCNFNKYYWWIFCFISIWNSYYIWIFGRNILFLMSFERIFNIDYIYWKFNKNKIGNGDLNNKNYLS